jgi:hypothetical protein
VARPIRHNLLDFTHDADAPGNAKFQALRDHYGGGDRGRAMEQRFWQLNCMIAKADGCRLDLTRLPIRLKARTDLELSDQDFDEFIAFLSDQVRCDLLRNEDRVVWTKRLQEELILANEAREAERLRKGNKRRESVAGVVRPESGGKPELSAGHGELSTGKPELSGGSPAENPIVRPESGGKGGFSGVLSSPLPSSPLPSGPGEEQTPPPSPPSAPAQEPTKLSYTKVDSLISRLQALDNGLLVGLQQRAQLEQLSAAVGEDTIVAVWQYSVRTKPKPLRFFLEDFAKVRAAWEKVKGNGAAPVGANIEAWRAERDAANPEDQRAVILEAARMNQKHHVRLTELQGAVLRQAEGELLTARDCELLGLPAPAVDTFDDSFPEATS